jgi:hypothetical protein
MQSEFYNGMLYSIEYKPHLSNNRYTQHHVYHIKTDEESYPKAHKAIASIMEDILGFEQGYIWDIGIYNLKNKMKPSIDNALHVHHKFEYDEKLDVFVYTFIRPYDD